MGWPVAHSRSPAIHNHWIRQYNLNGAYGLFPVNPNHLEAAIRGIQALGLAGCNITIPHKVEAMKCMDWVDPLAQRMGAINTIVVQADGSFEGYGSVFGVKDSYDEIVAPGAFSDSLAQHKAGLDIGHGFVMAASQLSSSTR
mgnify:CR=1 FL=1